MKKLPKVYQNTIDKKINNNKEVSYIKNLTEKSISIDNKSVKETLNDIFNGFGYAYNIPIIIRTKEKTYETSLVTKTENNIVTLDNDVIPIDRIISITKN